MKRKSEFVGEVVKINWPNKSIVKVFDEANDKYEEVVVKNVIPGQKIKGAITKKRNGKYIGRLIEILEKSEDEVVAPCPVFGKCGGCLFQSLPYAKQLELKSAQVKELLSPVVNNLDDIFEEIVANPNEFGYRNKMEYSFGDEVKDGPLVLGMHKRASTYDISPANDCKIVHEDFNSIVKYTVEFFENKGVSYYHKRTHEGFLRYLVLRRGVYSKELMVNLVTNDVTKKEELVNEWLEGLLNLNLEYSVVSVLNTINTTVADAIKPDEVKLLHGRDYINEQLLGLDFKISPFSFFQTNTLGAEELYKVVREFVGETEGKVVFDLYSGTGTIAQLVAPVAKKAVGVEIVEEAVEAAKENAKLNKLDNCEFIAGDVLKVIDDIDYKPDFIIIDPPRDGVHKKALEKIIDYGVKSMVYVSCKPTSLARDLKILIEAGYEPTRIKCVEQFSHTYHVETVCLVEKK